jgi:hypothetical protein
MATAQEKAQALLDELRKGHDNQEVCRDFLAAGTSIPDVLVTAALGNRVQQIDSCPRVLRLLLEGRANPHAEDSMGQSKLAVIHTACYHGTLEVVQTLLEFRADMESKDPTMKTPPLNTALAAGNAKVCLELLNRNADVQWTHQDGATALHVAAAWISSSHNSHLRMPPIGEEPRAVIAMMLHNGVDPTQTEGMSKGANRSTGMTPLETFRREIARSPWRSDEKIGAKFDRQAQTIYTLLEQGEEATKLKQQGNKAFKEKRNEDALKAWAQARKTWETAEVRGYHMAVLWNNEALCRRQTGDAEGSKAACNEGLTHYASKTIRDKLEHNLAECSKAPPELTEEEKEKVTEKVEQRKEKKVKQKEEEKDISKKVVDSQGGIYGEEGSAQKDYKVPGTFICPMDEAQKMGLGPPPPAKPWWEKRDADSDEEPERTTIGYLPAHHPKW